MTKNATPRGMATVNYWADDIPAAVEWYSKVLGIEPYFQRPEAPERAQYVEFRIGDHQAELGIVDRRFGPPAGAPGGAILYWAVDDVQAAFDRLLELGATDFQPPTPRGSGFVPAAVVDPFGNVFGVMENPHYQEMLGT
jgi:predicted enzyme related to lactoylglutathione lyase